MVVEKNETRFHIHHSFIHRYINIHVIFNGDVIFKYKKIYKMYIEQEFLDKRRRLMNK